MDDLSRSPGTDEEEEMPDKRSSLIRIIQVSPLRSTASCRFLPPPIDDNSVSIATVSDLRTIYYRIISWVIFLYQHDRPGVPRSIPCQVLRHHTRYMFPFKWQDGIWDK